MRSRSALLPLAIAPLAIWPAFAADAPNRAVCITGDGSAFASLAEGYERKRAAMDSAASPARAANVTFQVGGSLSDCLSNVKSGSQLVVIAQGASGSFDWDDGTGNGATTYMDFSTLPLAAGFAMLSNVSVNFVSSLSCAVPGAGRQSHCAKLMAAMNGARSNTGNNCSGFDNPATGYFVIDVDSADPSNPASSDEKMAAQKCAADDLFNGDSDGASWANSVPWGRDPGGDPTQIGQLQKVVSLCPGANGKVAVTKLIYLPPMDIVMNTPLRQCVP